MAHLIDETVHFTICPAHVQRIREHVNTSKTEEICGIVAGLNGYSTAVYPAANSLHRSDKFLIVAREQLNILLEIERCGWQVEIIYHTHLFSAPYPSETDVAEVYDQRVPSLIWGKSPDGWMCRAYLIQGQSISSLKIIQEKGSLRLTGVV